MTSDLSDSNPEAGDSEHTITAVSDNNNSSSCQHGRDEARGGDGEVEEEEGEEKSPALCRVTRSASRGCSGGSGLGKGGAMRRKRRRGEGLGERRERLGVRQAAKRIVTRVSEPEVFSLVVVQLRE